MAQSKRERFMQAILEPIAGITPGDGANVEYLKKTLGAMSDEQFTEYVRTLLPGETQNVLPFYIPNLTDVKIQLEDLLAVGELIGHAFYEQLWLTDPETGVTSLTPHKYPVVEMPIRRQAQLRYKKSSIPEHVRTVDDLSGQPVGDSKSAKISYPELQAQNAQDRLATTIEQIKIRCGDPKALAEMERMLLETGEASQEAILALNTVNKSNETVAVLLRSAHLDNNIDKPMTAPPPIKK